MNHSSSSAYSQSENRPADSSPSLDASPQILVLGGGEAGLAVLKSLADDGLAARLALIEPSSYHYDQPAWMQVGTEGLQKEQTRSHEHLQIPSGIPWIRERVAALDPQRRVVTTSDGTTVGYEYLVVALGTEGYWDRIRNLKDTLGTCGICSVYDYNQAEQAWKMIRNFDGGRALFTAPSTPYKGGSAPLGILRKAEALWRDRGVRADTSLYFVTAAGEEMFERQYPDLVERSDREPNLHVYTGHDLLEVRPDSKEAVFSVTKGQSQTEAVLQYDLLHVVPPMRPPAVLEGSGLVHERGPRRGYMDVDPDTLRHPRFDTVFGIGDVAGLEGVKTGERAREQAARVARVLARLVAQE